MSEFAVITLVTPKRLNMECRGSYSTAKLLLLAPKQPDASDITRRDEAGSSSIDYGRAVAAATGRRFKSSRPDFYSGERTRLACCDRRPRQSLFFRVQRSTPNSARAVFLLRAGLRFAGLRNQLLDLVRFARPRNTSNSDAKNRARSHWSRDTLHMIPSV